MERLDQKKVSGWRCRGKTAWCLGLVLVSLVACGAPSSLDLCLTDCAAEQRCRGLSTEEYNQCQASCTAQENDLQERDRAEDAQCHNASEIRRRSLECLSQECTVIVACGAAIDRRCQPR